MKKRFKRIWITIISTIIMASMFASNAFAATFVYDHGAGWYETPSLWYNSDSGSMTVTHTWVGDDGHSYSAGYASEGTVVYGSDRNGSSQHWDDNHVGSTVGYGYNSMCDYDDDDDGGGGGDEEIS